MQVTFCPVPADHGIVFVRTDLPDAAPIPLDVARRIEIPRRTCLVNAEQTAQVHMVEHILAALAGLGVDQCRVEINAEEVPGCDGSSQWFVDAIQRAGIVPLDAPRRIHRIQSVVRVGDERSWVEARPTEDDSLRLSYDLAYDDDGPIGRQSLEYRHSTDAFCRELSTARTFILEEEAEWLRSQGLGDRVTTADLLVFGPDGPIDNELRFSDECVRHKTLDLLGDLALGGCDWVGEFVSYRSGHRLNAELVQKVFQNARQDAGMARPCELREPVELQATRESS